MTHTPTPWKIKEIRSNKAPTAYYICAEQQTTIAAMNGPCDLYMNRQHDAAFIVTACNAHEALLEIAAAITEGVEINPVFIKSCKAAIALAEVKQP